MISRTLIANVGCTLIPVALVLVWPSLSTYEFSPRRVIHSLDTRAVLVAPWICRGTISAFVSRLMQTGIVIRSHPLIIVRAYVLWVGIALFRVLLGYLLTRSTSSGLGPPLLALLVLTGMRSWPELPGRRIQVVEPLVLGAICAVLTALDTAPWTYSIAVLLVMPITLAGRFIPPTLLEKTQLLPTPTTEQNPRPRSVLTCVLACLTVIIIPRLVPPPLYTVSFPSHSGPLLHILVLSYPRPHDNPESPILNTTLMSFLPLTVVPGITISVFTHAAVETHPSFEWAKARFPEVEFYADADQHPDASSGQHLHVAEALRWASSTRQAEWVMLLEDDFPLCGVRGRLDLARVMQKLERGRRLDYLERRGAFVGTGGSGLIFHRSLLPIVSTILKLHASTDSALPADVIRRPADLIMQDCLLGIDPLCPRRAEVMNMHAAPHSAPVAPGGNLVITSRLIIDHIGADASTTPGRQYGQDQWRCGWRHPFHGRDEVVVVVV
ncbi:hypothetical protein C8F04DRAFT_1084493 [Mycena alexandri]|uniref:Glycosyltransferase n=1 Tax=Mycena alexandri TaxID=1745969 RepID=A0AAD6XCA7_9AGAR|nr:hypothetical protein C8F04DRAFT_1084493 [Mycena alexandri]